MPGYVNVTVMPLTINALNANTILICTIQSGAVLTSFYMLKKKKIQSPEPYISS